MADDFLKDYVPVNERILAFHEKYPDGSLQSSWRVVEIGGQTWIVVEARAYRQPDDKRPGVGLASEPVPGLTPYTKNSELMVGETSAWGRALAALGFEVKRGIASREEVQNRSDGTERPDTGEKMTQGQRDYLVGKGNRKGLIKQSSLSDEAQVKFVGWADANLTKDGASKLIEALKDNPDEGAKLAILWAGGVSDVPVDTEGLPELSAEQKALLK